MTLQESRDRQDNLSMSFSIQTCFTELFTSCRSVVIVSKPGTPTDHKGSFHMDNNEAMLK